MKNIAKIAAVSAILSVGNIEAKNIERTDAMHCVSTDLQNLAKNIIRTDAINRVSTATATTTADFTKSREKLSENPPELKTVLAQYDSLKDTPEELRKYLKDNQITAKILQNWYDELNKDYTVSLNARNREASEINGYNQGHAKQYQKDVDDELAPLDKALEKNINQRVSIATMIELLEKPTAEDFAEKPSTIDQKSPAIVKWEKKYEMEIVDKDGRIYVYHNGEKVSSLLFPGFYKGKPTLNLTKDGKMVFTYADKEKENNITIYIPENGGMTEKSEDSEDQIYKFDKTTLAQN